MSFLKKQLPISSYLILAVAAFLVISFTACGEDSETPAVSPTAESSSSSSASFPVTVKDSDGRDILIEKRPERIVSLAPSHTEILFAIGADQQVAAVDRFSDFPAEVSALPKVEYSDPDPERLLGLAPDLILATGRQQKSVPALEALGLKVLLLAEPANIDGVYERIQTLGKATGHEPEAGALVKGMRSKLQEVTGKIQGVNAGPMVFYELTPELFTAGDKSFVGDMLRLLKARNVASGAGQAFPQLSQEAIIAANPEVILLTDSGSSGGQSLETVRSRPGWSGLTAVREGRVYPVDPNLVTRPGPRLVEGMETLAKLLYPNMFP